jgi:hypothetical protein
MIAGKQAIKVNQWTVAALIAFWALAMIVPAALPH